MTAMTTVPMPMPMEEEGDKLDGLLRFFDRDQLVDALKVLAHDVRQCYKLLHHSEGQHSTPIASLLSRLRLPLPDTGLAGRRRSRPPGPDSWTAPSNGIFIFISISISRFSINYVSVSSASSGTTVITPTATSSRCRGRRGRCISVDNDDRRWWAMTASALR